MGNNSILVDELDALPMYVFFGLGFDWIPKTTQVRVGIYTIPVLSLTVAALVALIIYDYNHTGVEFNLGFHF